MNIKCVYLRTIFCWIDLVIKDLTLKLTKRNNQTHLSPFDIKRNCMSYWFSIRSLIIIVNFSSHVEVYKVLVFIRTVSNISKIWSMLVVQFVAFIMFGKLVQLSFLVLSLFQKCAFSQIFLKRAWRF